MGKTIRFISIVCDAFFLRVKPVSTSANPACMINTRNPQSSIQDMFKPERVRVTCSASSCVVG